MRHSEYLRLLNAAGIDIVLDESKPDPGALSELKGFSLSDEFRHFSDDDIATLTSCLVAVRGQPHGAH